MKHTSKVLLGTCIGLYALGAAAFAMDPNAEQSSSVARAAPGPIADVDDALRGAANGMLTDDEIRAVCARPVSDLTRDAKQVLWDTSVKDGLRQAGQEAREVLMEARRQLSPELSLYALNVEYAGRMALLRAEFARMRVEISSVVAQRAGLEAEFGLHDSFNIMCNSSNQILFRLSRSLKAFRKRISDSRLELPKFTALYKAFSKYLLGAIWLPETMVVQGRESASKLEQDQNSMREDLLSKFLPEASEETKSKDFDAFVREAKDALRENAKAFEALGSLRREPRKKLEEMLREARSREKNGRLAFKSMLRKLIDQEQELGRETSNEKIICSKRYKF